MRKKKVPLRMCVGCREMKEKRELIRIVKNKESEISIDKTGKKNGRGAYICPSINCLEKARKTKILNREFEQTVPDEIYDNLKAQLEVDVEK